VWITAWDTTAAKTGGYVGARVVLAFINGATSALVFALIGMPSWLALGILTGVVAQFVPTIGTCIAIALPVTAMLLSLVAIYVQRHELIPGLARTPPQPEPAPTDG